MARGKSSTGSLYSNRTFFDGLDSYESELRLWKTKPPVTSLLGVFEIPEDVFYATIEDGLKYVGKGGYSVLYYDSDIERSNVVQRSSIGTGYACAVRNPYGKVQPVIFIRANINSSSCGEPSETTDESAAAIKLLILMHEMGHADDIARGVNFKHDALRLNLVDAEVYAHEFVCRNARRRGYRIALKYYLENICEHLKSAEESERLSAELLTRKIDISSLLQFANVVGESSDTLQRRLEKAGRYKEVVLRNSAKT